MTQAQIDLAIALSCCSLPIATRKKRFIQNMANLAQHAPHTELTPKQDTYLKLLRHYFRRQFPQPCRCDQCRPISLDQVGSGPATFA